MKEYDGKRPIPELLDEAAAQVISEDSEQTEDTNFALLLALPLPQPCCHSREIAVCRMQCPSLPASSP